MIEWHSTCAQTNSVRYKKHIRTRPSGLVVYHLAKFYSVRILSWQNTCYQYLFPASLWAICPRKFHKTRVRMITTPFSKRLSGDPSAPFVAGALMLPSEGWASHGTIILGSRGAGCGKKQ